MHVTQNVIYFSVVYYSQEVIVLRWLLKGIYLLFMVGLSSIGVLVAHKGKYTFLLARLRHSHAISRLPIVNSPGVAAIFWARPGSSLTILSRYVITSWLVSCMLAPLNCEVLWIVKSTWWARINSEARTLWEGTMFTNRAIYMISLRDWNILLLVRNVYEHLRFLETPLYHMYLINDTVVPIDPE